MEVWELNLRHLRAALEISRKGSINAAAEAVNLSQPAVTQGLAGLEAKLGVMLFERQSDGMQPYEAARLLTPRIEAALEHIGSPRVTTAQMRSFLALGEAMNYAGAAALIGISQASQHRCVADLALAVRRDLVERRGRGIALTPAGVKLLRNFRLARAELIAGLAEIENLKGRESGKITIGAMPLSRARLLPHAVVEFLKRSPEMALSVVEGSWHELAEQLRDGEIDLTIGALRGPSSDSGLAERELFVDAPRIYARKGHPLCAASETRAAPAHKAPGQNATDVQAPDLAELAKFPWVLAARGTPLRSHWEAMFAGAGIKPPAVPIECGSVMMIREIMLESDFLTVLSPDQVAAELEAGWLVALGDPPEAMKRSIGIIARANWRPTARQQAFVDTLVAVAQEHDAAGLGRG